MNVDYKNAEQFESIARSEGFHDLDVMGNGCYADDFLQHFYLGWQASREEGEPIGFLQSSGVSQLSGGHPAKLYPIGATPSPFESSTLVYTHPASSDEWIKCSERLPKESDGDCHGIVWVYNKGLSWVEISDLEDVKFISDYTHWMPTNLVRPEPPKQEEGQ